MKTVMANEKETGIKMVFSVPKACRRSECARVSVAGPSLRPGQQSRSELSKVLLEEEFLALFV